MENFDWHAKRTDLSDLAHLDRAPESEGTDLKAVRLYRLDRTRSQMIKNDLDAAIVSDPVNILYVTGTRENNNPRTRDLLLTATRSIMFEFAGCLHLAQGYEAVDEVRTAKSVKFTISGPKTHDKERKWPQGMANLVASLVGKRNATLGLDRMDANVAIALKELGLNSVNAQQAIETVRTIKSPEEFKCIVASLRATEIAVGKLHDAVSPGLTENQFWSVMHKFLIEQNRDYVENRLLSAGPLKEPWFLESASYAIQKNDLVILDTDEEQKETYRTALAQANHNMRILRPGLTFGEYADLAWDVPEKYWANRYFVSAHGCGLTGENLYLHHRGDFPDAGYDGVIEPGMVLCVESYIGKEGGTQGVKLEQQILITETGVQVMSKFPFNEAMLK